MALPLLQQQQRCWGPVHPPPPGGGVRCWDSTPPLNTREQAKRLPQRLGEEVRASAPEYYTALKRGWPGPRAATSVHRGRSTSLQGVRRVRSAARCWAAPRDGSTAAGGSGTAAGHSLALAVSLGESPMPSGPLVFMDKQGCTRRVTVKMTWGQSLGAVSPALGRMDHGTHSPSSLVQPHPGFGQRDRANFVKAEVWERVSAFLLPL